MKIKFLGTGGAHHYQKGTSAATVKTGEGIFLIDCGPSAYISLNQHNLLEQIDYLLPTHLHGDHTGGLFQLAVTLKHQFGKTLKIVYPTERIRDDLTQFMELMFQFDSYEFVPLSEFKTVGHIDTFGQHVPEMPTVAYYFRENDELIYYSGDLGNIDTTLDFLKNRTEANIRVFHDINKRIGGKGHVSYQEVQEKLKDYDVYGYHCAKEEMPEDCITPLVEDYPELNY